MLNLTLTTVVALAISLTGPQRGGVISQRREIEDMNRSLHLLLQKDPLTGLLNRRAFQECVELHLRAGEEVALVMVDLDDFKGVNDCFGHPCGDHVLQQAADKLREVFPEAVGVGRVGGDEFAVAWRPPAPPGWKRRPAAWWRRSPASAGGSRTWEPVAAWGPARRGRSPSPPFTSRRTGPCTRAKAQGKGRWILQAPGEDAPLRPGASL